MGVPGEDMVLPGEGDVVARGCDAAVGWAQVATSARTLDRANHASTVMGAQMHQTAVSTPVNQSTPVLMTEMTLAGGCVEPGGPHMTDWLCIFVRWNSRVK